MLSWLDLILVLFAVVMFLVVLDLWPTLSLDWMLLCVADFCCFVGPFCLCVSLIS